MHIIIMPPQLIIIGMPIACMFIICWQQAMNMSFMAASIGIISQVMPLSVMVHFIVPIIMGIGIIPFIMPFIGIMPGIIPFMGIMPPIIGIGIIPPIMGMAIAALVMRFAPRIWIR
jgi:hypothetical protein